LKKGNISAAEGLVLCIHNGQKVTPVQPSTCSLHSHNIQSQRVILGKHDTHRRGDLFISLAHFILRYVVCALEYACFYENPCRSPWLLYYSLLTYIFSFPLSILQETQGQVMCQTIASNVYRGRCTKYVETYQRNHRSNRSRFRQGKQIQQAVDCLNFYTAYSELLHIRSHAVSNNSKSQESATASVKRYNVHINPTRA
jgi:hypothetical protein